MMQIPINAKLITDRTAFAEGKFFGGMRGEDRLSAIAIGYREEAFDRIRLCVLRAFPWLFSVLKMF